MRGFRSWAFILLIVAGALAGCTGPPSKNSGTDATPTFPSGGGKGPGGLPLPNATVPTLQFLGCQGQGFLLQLQQEKVRPLVPDAFTILPAIHPGSAALYLTLTTCDRTLSEREVYGAATSLLIWAQVEPTNSSWADADHASAYLIAAVSNLQGLARELQNWSVDSILGSFTATKTPSLQGNNVEHWVVQASPETYTFDIPALEVDPSATHLEYFVWTGAGPFFRHSIVEDYRQLALLIGGPFIVQGNGVLQSAMTAPAMPYVGITMRDYASTIQLDGSWSVGG